MSSSRQIGYAVLGLGNIAKVAVLPAFANCKHSRLVAVVSRDKHKAEMLSEQFDNVSAYSSSTFSDCLANPRVNAVYLATPQGEHLSATVAAAKAGKHVLCEKPLATTVKDSARMVAVCRRHGVQLMTAYRKYFEPATVYIKKQIRDGALGRIRMIHSAFSELYVPGTSAAWMMNRTMAGGGPLMDLGIYCVNTSRWLVDEDPIEASARTWHNSAKHFREVEEGLSFQLHFRSGLSVEGSTTYSAALSSFLYVQGSTGWLSLSPAFTFDEDRKLTGKISGRWIERTFPVIDEFALEIDAFSKAIVSDHSVEPDGAQGHRDMIILGALYESAKKRKPVAIRYPANARTGRAGKSR